MKKIGDITNTADKNGEFTDGNVAAGTPPTQLMGAWFNSVQREILNVLAKAGVPQSATKEDQLAEAITKLVAGAGYLPTGYSYSKIESDDRYQPKGEYAPAGDYATNAALNNGLELKLDKTGGGIKGNNGVLYLNSTIANQPLYMSFFDSASKRLGYVGRPDSKEDIALVNTVAGSALRLTADNKLTFNNVDVIRMGDFGIGKNSSVMLAQSGVVVSDYRINGPAYCYGGATSDTYNKGNHTLFNIFAHTTGNYGAQFAFPIGGRSEFGFRVINNNAVLDWCTLYHTSNTTTDRNGNLKVVGASNDLSDYPVGSPIPWPQATAPTGFLICNGQTFNKTTYPLLGAAYPSGKLPDLRGEFIRGLDAGRNIDSARAVLSAQSDAMQEISGEVTGTKDISSENGHATGAFAFVRSATSKTSRAEWGEPNNAIYDFKASRAVRTANENRPRNIAFLYIVRAE